MNVHSVGVLIAQILNLLSDNFNFNAGTLNSLFVKLHVYVNVYKIPREVMYCYVKLCPTKVQIISQT
jgi:hypothetical protein